MQWSEKQRQALVLLGSGVPNVMLAGGSRSGKTTSIVEKIWGNAYLVPGSRQIIGRAHMNAAVASIWRETFRKVKKQYDPSTYTFHEQEHFVSFFNDSEIHLIGYDNEERVEKVFGREFAVMYHNEASEIPYQIIVKASTRLAQNCVDIKGRPFRNKTYFDLNPPAPTHWGHKLFIEKKDPITGKPLSNPEDYAHLVMNPSDAHWLSADYLRILDNLPDRARLCFRDGEWVKPEGAIYDAWTFEQFHLMRPMLPKFEYYTVGIDHSGTRFAAILDRLAGELVVLLDEIYMYRETLQNLDRMCQYKWRQYNYQGYGDPSQPTYNTSMWNVLPAENAVDPGLNYILQKIQNGQLFMFMRPDGNPGLPQLLAEIDSYKRDDKGRIVKENDDGCDAMRYGMFTHAMFGGSILSEGSVFVTR